MPKAFPPLALLHGEDEFAIAEEVARFRAALGDPSVASINISEFDASATLNDIRSSAEAMPFLAERRLVILYGMLHQLTGSEKTKQERLAALLAYLADLPPTTTVLLVEPKALPRNNRALKQVSSLDGALVRKLDLPQGPDVVKWIEARAKKHGGQFSRAGAQALAAAVGDYPRELDTEIVKLLTYVDFIRPVDAPDVERLTPASGQATVFQMVDALGQRNGRAAARSLHTLLAQPGQDAHAIFGMVVRQFRLLVQARDLLDRRANPASIGAALGVQDFVARKLLDQARNFNMATLRRVYERLLDFDVEMKTGKLDAELALDLMVMALAR